MQLDPEKEPVRSNCCMSISDALVRAPKRMRFVEPPFCIRTARAHYNYDSCAPHVLNLERFRAIPLRVTVCKLWVLGNIASVNR